MKELNRIKLLVLLIIVISYSCCDKSFEPLASAITYQYRVPAQTGDGWQTAHLADVGINENMLVELMDSIANGRYNNIHSILIIKDGKLVFEEYFAGYRYDWHSENFKGEYCNYTMNTLHNIHSVTKSITSALLGIAIDQGLINGVQDSVFTFFPEYAHLSGPEKNSITLKHLLTMTCGLDWNENDVSAGDMSNDVVQLFLVPDPIKYVLAKPIVTNPGAVFYYHSGGVNVLGEILKKATGLRIDIFAEQHLLHPLGITEMQWNFVKPDIVFVSGDLQLRPRDMAKFGYLYLNKGLYNGRRLISEPWIEASLQKQYAFQGDNWTGYGYLWWLREDSLATKDIRSYHALGWGGQRTIVLPGMNMVVVFSGGNYVTPEPVDRILVRYILPAVSAN